MTQIRPKYSFKTKSKGGISLISKTPEEFQQLVDLKKAWPINKDRAKYYQNMDRLIIYTLKKLKLSDENETELFALMGAAE